MPRIPGEFDFHDGDLDGLAGFDDFAVVLDEVGGELTEGDEAVLVDANVADGSKGGDVGDDAGEFHADLEVGGFWHALGEDHPFDLT